LKAVNNNIEYWLEIAKDAAMRAGFAILDVYNSGEFFTDIKQDNSPLTIADKASHRIITAALKKTNLPVLSEEGATIHLDKRKSWDYFWLIDPLDGTKEFINKNGEFTVNIALVRNKFAVAGVIYTPCNDILYYGAKENGIFKNEKGKITQFSPLPKKQTFTDLIKKEHVSIVSSRSHQTAETKEFINQFKHFTLISKGSSLKFMLLLEEKADLYPRLGPTMEWDTAAAHAILNVSNRGIYQIDLRSELTYNKTNLKNPFFVAFYLYVRNAFTQLSYH
jgi:3'(2'), 5'-bisphosphate nucleotidase